MDEIHLQRSLDHIEETLLEIEERLYELTVVIQNHGEALSRMRATQLAIRGMLSVVTEPNESEPPA